MTRRDEIPFLWDKEERFVRSAPHGHEPDCTCDGCHRIHIERSEVESNAKAKPPFKCCVDELDGAREG